MAQTEEPATAGTAVVVSDVASDMTENAKARAKAYEAVRARGFEAKGKLDVNAAAMGVGALEAGKVTTDQAKLGQLRTALGVTLLVRISREWEKPAVIGVRVTVVSDKGTKSQVVEAPKGNPQGPTLEMLASLLDEVAPAPKPKKEAPPVAAAPEQSWTVLHEGSDSPKWAAPTAADDPKVRRRKWEERGGAKFALDARINVTMLGLFDVDFTDPQDRPGETGVRDSGTANVLGIGGGPGLRLGLMYLPLPDPTTQIGFFTAFKLMVGADPGLAWVSEPVGFTYRGIIGQPLIREVERADYGIFSLQVPIQLGLAFGIGNYRTADQWRGLVLGLTYAPTFVYFLEIGGEARSDNLFNYGGAEISLDVTKLRLKETEAGAGSHSTVGSQLGTDPHMRFAVSFLPPIDSDFPMFLNASVGAAWY